MDPASPFSVLLGVSQLLYLTVIGLLGVRLLALARRNRELPEALLAVHFLLCLGLGYLLLVVGLTAARDPGLLAPWLATGLVGVGYAISSVGVLAGAGFTALVFRRDSRWAHAGVGLAVAAIAVGYVGYGLSGGFSHGRFAGPWWFLLYGTYVAVAIWVMWEPLRYHGVMRRRQALGLADPLLVDRFRLWGIGSLCRVIMVVGGAIPPLLYPDQPVDLKPGIITNMLVGVALTGLGVVVAYGYAFFPTRSYVRRVIGRASGPS